MEERLKEWADRVGRPVSELAEECKAIKASLKIAIPGRDEKWYDDAAIRREFLRIKSDLQSPAKPYDVVFLGYSGALDVTATEIAEKRALWENLSTREQAVAEGQVYRHDPSAGPRMQTTVDGKKVDVADGMPLDTREWMIPPDPEKGTPGRRNPRRGKPLAPLMIRTQIGLGKPTTGKDIKFVSVMTTGDRVKDLPPLFKPVRSRLNLRSEDAYRYVCNASTKTRYEPTVMPEFQPEMLTAVIEMLEAAPNRMAINQLAEYHKANERDARRIVVVEGDVSRINREPTAFGSYLLVIEDVSKEDLEAEGLTVWVPGDLEDQLDFGVGSRILVVGRTTIGAGFNRETGQLDAAIERILLNAVAIVALPEWRVPPEEERVIEGAETVA